MKTCRRSARRWVVGGRYAFRCNGLNHATWYSDIVIDGVALADISAPLVAPREYDEEHKLRFELSLGLARENPGYWPNSYLPYYLFPDAFVEQARRVGPRSDVVAASLGRYYAHFEAEGQERQAAIALVPRIAWFWRHGRHRDSGPGVCHSPANWCSTCPIMERPRRSRRDTVIETRVRVSRAGVERISAPSMPASFDRSGCATGTLPDFYRPSRRWRRRAGAGDGAGRQPTGRR